MMTIKGDIVNMMRMEYYKRKAYGCGYGDDEEEDGEIQCMVFYERFIVPVERDTVMAINIHMVIVKADTVTIVKMVHCGWCMVKKKPGLCEANLCVKYAFICMKETVSV